MIPIADVLIKILYVFLALLVFGVLVLIHEGGHFLFARLFRVTVEEFSIGMGPKLISRKSKKSGITYSWRVFPIGGFVAMVGEDEDSEDANAFCNKPVWQRMIITAAGATVNLVAGFIAMMILVACTSTFGGTTVAEFIPGDVFVEQGYDYHSSAEAGLEVGDTIVAVNGERVHILNELQYELVHAGNEPLTLTVERGDETLTLENVLVPQIEEQGVLFGMRDFYVRAQEKTFSTVIRHGFYRSVSAVKMIWESLADLVGGRYGIQAVSGPVGVTQTLAEAARSGPDQFIYLAIIISINLGIMNLLPLPALDGGRLLFQLIELVFRRPVPRKVEGYVHFAGIMLLFALMAFITLKDLIGLF